MLELRKSNTMKRGEVMLIVNSKDSKVIHEFLQKSIENKILEFITIGDINNIAKNAERIQKKRLCIKIEQNELVPGQELAKSITVKIKDNNDNLEG